MKLTKISILLVSVLGGILSCSAQEFTVGNYTFREGRAEGFEEDKADYASDPEKICTLVGIDGDETDVTIPGIVTYNGVEYSILYIANEANRNPNIERLTISEPTRYIGERAFQGKTIKFLSLPASMKWIDTFAFLACPVEEVRCYSVAPPVCHGYHYFEFERTQPYAPTISHWGFKGIFKYGEGYTKNPYYEPWIDEYTPAVSVHATLHVPEPSLSKYQWFWPADPENIYNPQPLWSGGDWPYFDAYEALDDWTGVNEVKTVPLSPVGNVYDITGNLIGKNMTDKDIKSLPAGLYIHNGKKILVKR